MDISTNLAASLKNGFIDCNMKSIEKYNPKLLVNDYKRGMKVLTSIESELRNCDEFYFSVAFITGSGVVSLINTLKELEERGVRGKIITSQYQNFTQPGALRRLLKFKNIQLKIVTDEDFHAKGYIFRHKDSYSFIIGSSNLTQKALAENKEWNLKLSSLENGSVMQNIFKEFERTFENATEVTEAWIEEYEKIYTQVKTIEKQTPVVSLKTINPNKMQYEALRQLEALRKEGKKKALLISATGTGKTYLSAFDVRKFEAKKVLFLVHRENIARAAMESFKRVLGYNINAGVLSGSNKRFDYDYTFAMVQTMSKDDNLKQFTPDYFDYIIIDEVHRAGAATYTKIIEHFRPEFMLGMTATPERTDGFDIFSLFDYNIAYEIRLHRALEENMLVPFHYFGVTEISVDGEILDDNSDFNKLVCEQRVSHIIDNARYYSSSDSRVKGLVFCSRNKEAKELSDAFNSRGFRTVSLSGADSEEQRETAIKLLESNGDEHLDYIFTVDIFNEGIDIPSVNQLIMLRPTQSAIIFVQQLGRGLRKYPGKEYLTVIDFIGNYSNNYLVPIALYGERSYNKDTIRKLINTGSSTIPGCSTINFDRITKERIYKSIEETNLSTRAELKKEYELMKYRLGRAPMMTDFIEQGGREPFAFVEYKNKSSYYDFVKSIDSENHPDMEDDDRKLLAFYSSEILNCKRFEEAAMLVLLKAKQQADINEFKSLVHDRFGYEPDMDTTTSAVNNLNGQFMKGGDIAAYNMKQNISIEGSSIVMDRGHFDRLNSEPLNTYLSDMISYCAKKMIADFDSSRFRGGFMLYDKYSRKDVCRILNWDKNEESTMYGYRIKYNTCPVFVTYHKNDDIAGSTKYEDSFINPNCFSWMTRNRVTLEHKDVEAIRGYETSGLRILLFVKKSDGEGTDFYYMGDMEPAEYAQQAITNDKGKELPIVNIIFSMKDEVEESIYNYFEG